MWGQPEGALVRGGGSDICFVDVLLVICPAYTWLGKGEPGTLQVIRWFLGRALAEELEEEGTERQFCQSRLQQE